MNPFVVYLLKMGLCSGVLYGYYHLALRNRVFHRYNRFYLLAAVVFSLLFPLVPLPVSFSTAPPPEAIPLYGLLYFGGSESMIVANGNKGLDLAYLPAVLYGLLCLVLCGRLVAGLVQIGLLTLRSEVRRSGNVTFIPTDHKAAPFSFFSLLFWKKELALESAEGQAIFRHELVHIREKHSADKMFLQAACALFWINPFFWLFARELAMIHEFIADKKSVGPAGTEALARMIMQSLYGTRYPGFINPFFQQPIKRRLAMLQKTMKQPQNAYIGRVLALPLCALLFFACAKKEENPLAAKPAIAKTTLSDTLPIADIKEVRVNNNDSAKTVTIVYKTGKEETLTEEQALKKGWIKPPPPPPVPNLTLLVIDGAEQGIVGDGKKLNAIKGEDIESMNVLKGEDAIKKYGAKGKEGVIEIITKKGKGNSTSGASGMKPRQDATIVFAEVEQPPHFLDGEQAWQAFLQKNLNASTPVNHGAPSGTYPIQVQFKVANDGTISDIKALTSFGYGMEEEVVALLQKSPKWAPAQQNGHTVTAIHKQPVTFVVAEK